MNGSCKKNISDTLKLSFNSNSNFKNFTLEPTKNLIDIYMCTKSSYYDGKDIKDTDVILYTGTKDLKTGKFHLELHQRNKDYDVLPFDVLKKKHPKLLNYLKDITEFLESLHPESKTRNNKKCNFNWYSKNKGILRLETNIDGQKCSVRHDSGKTILDLLTEKILSTLQLDVILDEETIKITYESLKYLEVPDKKEKDEALSILRKILEKKMYINRSNNEKNPLIDLSKIIKSIYKGTIEAFITKNSTDFFHNKIEHSFYCKKNLDTEKFNSKVTYEKTIKLEKPIKTEIFVDVQISTPPTPLKILTTDELTKSQKETIKMMKEKINLLHKAIETTFFFKFSKKATPKKLFIQPVPLM